MTCIRCRLDFVSTTPLCAACRAQLGPDGAALVEAAYRAHEAAGCRSCDPKYVWTCRTFQAAVLNTARS